MIKLAIDFTSAQSYLALSPTVALAEEIDAPLIVLPYRVPVTRRPQRPAGEETVKERHARVRAEYTAADIARYARVQGIELAARAEDVDSTIALSGLLWANHENKGVEYAQAVFRKFWQGTLALDDAEAIVSILDTCGAPGFDGKPAAALEEVRDVLAEKGVFTVPMYVVDGQTFLGRQHLPMIRWLLTDRSGPPPI